jgi:DeoR family ulaG and ulaABCDEF operon transcriptional repressor
VDSSKFSARSSLILCPLERISTVVTDEGIPDSAANMLEQADVKLIVAQSNAAQTKATSSG